MSGPRYSDWTHVRVVGSRADAAPHLPHARKLLGFVFQEAQRNNLGVHKLKRTLPDGTVLIAEKHGAIPRITIVPVPTSGGGRRRTVEGFYLTWAGDEEDQTPVLFLDPKVAPDEEGWKDWRSMFFNSDAVGYEATPEDRRAGSYIDVFGPKTKEPGKRLLHGNGRWTGEDGQVVSWFRGYTSYWPHHYRHPVTNYSNAVSIYGHIVYVTPNPAWRVLAAARRDAWLYVMLAEDLGAIEPPDLPARPSYASQVWYSQPFADTPYTYALWRYPLRVVTEPDTGIESYRADPEQGQKLWTQQIELAYGAWSFNHDCTSCVTVQLPRKAVWCWVFTLTEDEQDWVPSPVEYDHYPEVAAQRLEVVIDHSSLDPTTTFSQTLAPTLIAEADGTKLEIVEVDVTSTYVRNDYKLGDFTVPIVEVVVGTGLKSYMHRTMIFADLPTKTLLLYRWRTDIDPIRFVSAGFELYVDGVQVPLDDPTAVETGFASGPYDGPAASNFAIQMAIAYDNSSGAAWRRPMDAMTYLLGFGFEQVGSINATGTPGQPGAGYARVPHVARTISIDDTGTLDVAHSAAGGYVFGTVNGPPEAQFWVPNADYARMYGANNGDYVDDEPMTTPVVGRFGAAAASPDNTIAVVGLHPMLGLTVGFEPNSLSNLMTAWRTIRFGTNGDAKTLIDGVLGDNQNWQGFTLGYTGKPRRNQRGVFAWP